MTLELPWRNVFTTNYDTLLERTREKIQGYDYSIINVKSDFFPSKAQKIIKLHGSFPSHKPFIITEKDYKSYPKKFAPFVTSVHSALLEDTICLIGFSGDDPNFLDWYGWLRKHLEKEAKKVYLISILSLTEAQKVEFTKRNIIALDISRCVDTQVDQYKRNILPFEPTKSVDVIENHKKALDIFFEYLNSNKRNEISEIKNDNLTYSEKSEVSIIIKEWPQNNIDSHYSQGKDALLKVPEILENWKSIRKEFPNWLIVPEDRRDMLTSNIDNSFIFHLSEMDSPADIHFLYEYNWRIEKCLVPIYNNLIPYYEKTINKYNPFPELVEIENAIIPSQKELDWAKINPIWIDLQLAIMRNFREEAEREKWQQYNTRLEKLTRKFEPEMLAQFHYERCLQALFSLNIANLRKEIDIWPINTSLPYWEAKRATLLAEIGDVVEAEKILESSLVEIRNSLKLNYITDDYSNISQEAYLLFIYRNIKFSSNIYRGEYSVPKEINEDIKRRKSISVQFKCDPDLELELFEIKLEKDVNDYKPEKEKIGFDINNKTTTYHWGHNKDTQVAYAYLRFVEEIGIPLHIPNMSAMGASKNVIKHVADYSSFWAFITFLRVGENELVDNLFDRKSIYRINHEVIDSNIDEYISVLLRSSDEIKKGNAFRNKTFAINLSELLPEVLSRLCVKSSFEKKLKLLDLLKNVYECDYKDRFRGIKNLCKRLLNSFSKSEQYAIIPKLLEFSILPELHHVINDEYVDPFDFINPQKGKEKINVSEKIFQWLIDLGKKEGKERTTAIKRLVVLYSLELLSVEQTSQLADAIWCQIDEKNGFPSGLNWYYFSYINLPHPSGINPEEILKSYISPIEIPIQSNEKEQGVSMTHGYIQEFEEIIGTGRSSVLFTWTNESLNKLVEKIVTWWEADKHYLKTKDKPGLFGSTQKEFKARFRNLIDLYSVIFGPNYQLLNPANQIEILRILQEFEEYGLSDNEAFAAFYNYLPSSHENIFSKIYDGLFSKSKDQIVDSLRGIIKLVKLKVGNVGSLVLLISEQIRNRNETDLVSFLDVMNLIVSDYKDLLTIDILSNIEFGLKRLVSETEISNDDTVAIVSEKISIRKEVSELTVALFGYYKSEDQEIPEYINQWRMLSLDKNEFSEIRRIWLDVVE